jgi:Ca2+-binding EF-hand superfamily protein
MESSKSDKIKAEKMSISEIRNKLRGYETKRWQQSRGKYLEFDINTTNKFKKYYLDIASINSDGKEGMGIDQLEDPFISLGLAYNRDEVKNLIGSVDDDGSGRIEFDEFLRIIHNKSKKTAKGNEKITNFFKNLAHDNISAETDLKHFSFKTIMGIIRRNNLLKAFLAEDKNEKEEGEKVLKAFCTMLERK